MSEEGGAEPTWLSRLVIEVIHRAQIREHGGSFGVRDVGRLEAALARPRNRWAYWENPDLAELAAAYAHGFTRNHPFVDGNKRVAFLAAYTFLGVNDHDLAVSEPEVVAMVVALSTGELSEEEFAAWVRHHMRPVEGASGR